MFSIVYDEENFGDLQGAQVTTVNIERSPGDPLHSPISIVLHVRGILLTATWSHGKVLGDAIMTRNRAKKTFKLDHYSDEHFGFSLMPKLVRCWYIYCRGQDGCRSDHLIVLCKSKRWKQHHERIGSCFANEFAPDDEFIAGFEEEWQDFTII